jgi:hypothetical protein
LVTTLKRLMRILSGPASRVRGAQPNPISCP